MSIFGVSEKIFIEITSFLFILFSLFIAYQFAFKNMKSPYGRFEPNPKSRFNVLVPSNLAFIIMPLPSFLLPIYALWKRGFDVPLVNLSIVLMFVGHYFQRVFIYGRNIRGGKPSTLETACFAIALTSFDGYIQGFYHTNDNVNYPPGHLYSITSIIGISMFAWGLFTNMQSDKILRNLRKPGESGYKIPRGGMFEYVSGANFLGEIVEWFGFALYAQSLPALALAIGSLSNIGPRAWLHHQWYLEKFKEYPKNRKALVPFIF